MNLLIVDDMTNVVKGLETGIAWKMLGINNVFSAYNAQEAKEILVQYPIHIMLCDIEMPKENGIQLLNWMRSQNMETECIFLTAHADFEYMQEAIRAKGSDYILQPAPYDEVKKAVCNAMQKIFEKQKVEQVYSYGKVMLNYQESLKGSIFHELIDGKLQKVKYEEYEKAIPLPKWEQMCYPVLFHIEENEQLSEFSIELLQFVMLNIGSELFSGYEQEILLYSANKSVFYMLVYGTKGYVMDYEGVKRQLETFLKSIQNFLVSHVAGYSMEGVQTKNLFKAYEKLMVMHDKNVILKEGLFVNQSDQDIEKTDGYQMVSIDRWKEYIINGYGDTVKIELIQFLKDLAENGKLNPTTLYYFYMDFTYLIFESISQRGMDPHEFMEKTQNSKIYQTAIKTLPNMIQFIETTFENMKGADNTEVIKVGKLVKQYVHDHISQEIKRSDIADKLHLNVDYLARIFKKEMGITLKEYILNEKMKVAKNLITSTALPMSFVATKVGYDNFSHFSQSYKKVYGVSPSSDRKQ
jgi:Response regulator containing CheY-like receiver domain and AraC-type DNA-binding domain